MRNSVLFRSICTVTVTVKVSFLDIVILISLQNTRNH